MQSNFLPQKVPQIAGWEFSARWLPAREVAGDYYDFIPVGSNGLGLVIADVTDKGAPAALFMVFTNSIIRGSVYPMMAPAESISNANRLICDKSTNAMFVSMVYTLINTASGEATWVIAGHNPPLMYRSADDSLQRLPRTGMVLGINPAANFEQRSATLIPGDFLLLYTDGVIDAIDTAEREFGMDRLEKLVYDNRTQTAEEIVQRIEQAVSEHTGNITPFDDITILLVKRV
jgi:sigma-B regulation protein RsbU (phosphoserine phosphatase)